ncbi:MAG: thiol reductase thioredoxin [Bacteroidales bacterium]|nr:thiol reductase thioredoxin [Bacteroidales bacterium]
MKKISSLLLIVTFVALAAYGCNSTSGNGAGNSPDDKTSVKIEYLTKETFKQKIWDYEKNPQTWVYEGKEPAIIDFYADWCRPCRMVAPILDELSVEYDGKIKIYKIDTQVERELAGVFQVQSIPAFLYIPMEGQPQMDKGLKDKETFTRIIDEVLLKK